MGYRANCIITHFDDDKNFNKVLENSFKHTIIKSFIHPFKGIIALINIYDIMNDFLEGKNKYGFSEEEDLYSYICYYIEDNLPEFSKKYPTKLFVYIDADCAGGTCMYNGYTIKNGEKIIEEKLDHHSHIKLLQQISPSFNEWFFEPFTRNFFN